MATPTPKTTVTMLSPDGQSGEIPVEQVDAAEKAGFTRAVRMTAPDGSTGVVPVDRASEAQKAGYRVSQPVVSANMQPSYEAMALENSPVDVNPENPGNPNMMAIPPDARADVNKRLLPISIGEAGGYLVGGLPPSLRQLVTRVGQGALGAIEGKYGGRGIGYAVGGEKGENLGGRIGSAVGLGAGLLGYEPLSLGLGSMGQRLLGSVLRPGEAAAAEVPPKLGPLVPGTTADLSSEDAEGHLIVSPEEARSEEQLERIARERARARGLRYAAGQKPGGMLGRINFGGPSE
jgi:hypothetical protein